MIKEVIQYQTEDGKLFDNYTKAVNHENQLEYKKFEPLKKLVDTAFNYFSEETRQRIFIGLLDNQPEFHKHLTPLQLNSNEEKMIDPLFGDINELGSGVRDILNAMLNDHKTNNSPQRKIRIRTNERSK